MKSFLIVFSTSILLFGFLTFAVENLSIPKNANLKVASFNIQYAYTPEQMFWQTRKDAAKSLLLYNDFDIVGLQEIHPHQIEYFQPEHCSNIGMGLNTKGDDKGENVPIMYRKDKVELLDSGVFWISETPEDFSKGWDAANRRICVWGKFKELATGKVLYFFNTHLDHRGKLARSEGIKLLMRKIPEIASDNPFVLTGDFNISLTTTAIKPMLESKMFFHAKDISVKPPYCPSGTFHGYTGLAKVFIDYIFVSANVKVNSYAVLTDRISKVNFNSKKKFRQQKDVDYASDHFPVVAEISF